MSNWFEPFSNKLINAAFKHACTSAVIIRQHFIQSAIYVIFALISNFDLIDWRTAADGFQPFIILKILNFIQFEIYFQVPHQVPQQFIFFKFHNNLFSSFFKNNSFSEFKNSIWFANLSSSSASHLNWFPLHAQKKWIINLECKFIWQPLNATS